jgi:hypothetical protein
MESKHPKKGESISKKWVSNTGLMITRIHNVLFKINWFVREVVVNDIIKLKCNINVISLV